ncbi:chitodextrinase [Acidovorax soli]|uniref:Chitodextrinase n=1 Tax=Acidovorax soli TaxID=592050 RepID=A0A7X0P979_9BURK|nr:hypothetical protein [Acidovorax soli]MBB6557648.1 chitodextrinase [Acidovorax soli]
MQHNTARKGAAPLAPTPCASAAATALALLGLCCAGAAHAAPQLAPALLDSSSCFQKNQGLLAQGRLDFSGESPEASFDLYKGATYQGQWAFQNTQGHWVLVSPGNAVVPAAALAVRHPQRAHGAGVNTLDVSLAEPGLREASTLPGLTLFVGYGATGPQSFGDLLARQRFGIVGQFAGHEPARERCDGLAPASATSPGTGAGGTPAPVPAGDRVAPSAPPGLAVSNPSATSVLLQWGASSDNVAVVGYRVYVDGGLAATVAGTSHALTGLAPGQKPLLEVEAYDAAGNASERSSVAWADASVYRHGDKVTVQGALGTADVVHTFLGGSSGLVESTAVGAKPANAQGWRFNQLGGPTTVALDARRGKVLFTPEDSRNYNAVRRFDPGASIPEQRHFYKAHWVRNVVLLDGLPYAKSYQWKHERVNWEDTVVDGDTEIKVHNQTKVAGLVTYVNRSASDKSTYWNYQAAPDSNSDWVLMEILVYTGTQGLNDGKLITRVHKNGRTWVNQNRQAEKIYADPGMRLRYFIEQNYFGNFGQREDGVDNPLPKPQVRELYSDDSRVIIGNDASSGWKRVELRDSVALAQAKVREVQSWTIWNGRIELSLNTGGLARGTHDLHLVVIDGVDANGWDVVRHSQPIRVQVD